MLLKWSRLTVRATWATVEPDRNRVAEPRALKYHSRNLMICRPVDVVDLEKFGGYFGSEFAYQIDEVVPLTLGLPINVIEWRFGSYRCQAEWDWIVL